MMNDAARALIKNISSNYIRAQQAEGEGDDRATLRHLSFAAQDIPKLLRAWQVNQIDDAMAVSYADSLIHTTARIKELIAKGVPKTMINHIGQFECRILRDAMHIAAQCSDRARMKIDATGIHIRAKDATLTTMAWIDIPTTAFGKDYHPEDPIFKDDIGINCEKLHRMLNAYEPAATIEFCLESREGVGELTTITGTEGTLWTYQTSHDYSDTSIPLLNRIQASHPPAVSGVRDADYFREWLRRIEDNEIAISFRYEKGSGKFPIKTVSEHTGLLPVVAVLSHPEASEDVDSLQTLISLELLQEAISPQCIDGDIKFSFGDDTPLYISTQVNGCDVAMAIAPRIEAE